VTFRASAFWAIVALVVAAVSAWLLASVMRHRWQHAVLDTPVQRGKVVAERMGCFGCHGASGGQPIANPGAKGGEVPGWTGGTWMMWNRDERDVRAWIVKGRPDHREADTGALIRMPAYGERLTPGETDDLVAFVLAASHFGPSPEGRAAAGHDAAYRLGCFGCHGPEGRGLVMNPGSFEASVQLLEPIGSDTFVELAVGPASIVARANIPRRTLGARSSDRRALPSCVL